MFKSKGVLFEGQTYAENDVVVIGFASGNDVFLLSDTTIIHQFDCHYNSYEVECSGLFEAINVDALYDYHP